MGDLHRRGVGVTVGCDDLDAEALQLDRHLLAELPGAEQQDAKRMRGQRRAKGGHADSNRISRSVPSLASAPTGAAHRFQSRRTATDAWPMCRLQTTPPYRQAFPNTIPAARAHAA